MLLVFKPKNPVLKHPKIHKTKYKQATTSKNTKLHLYNYGLKVKKNIWVNLKKLEDIEYKHARVLQHKRNKYNLKSNYNHQLPLTKKSIGTRMGKGKSPINKYVIALRKNSICYEFNTSNYKDNIKLFKWSKKHINAPTQICYRFINK